MHFRDDENPSPCDCIEIETNQLSVRTPAQGCIQISGQMGASSSLEVNVE